MNSYGLVVLVALVGTFLIRLLADYLNLRAANPSVPEAFADVFEPDAYRRSQEYLGANTRLSRMESTVDLMLLLVFWFAGGFNALDQLLRGFGYGSVVTGVLYIGALLLLQSLMSLPFQLFRTFGIEERFGFNKTTPGVFVADLARTLLLAVLFGIPVIALILWFFERGGAFAWLWAWGGVSLFSLLLQYMAPTLIMPLFNRFVPLEDGPLKSAILNYAASVRFPLSGIFVIDGSKRSAKANAFFTGFGRNKRIALFDTLISNHTTGELLAVLAHEIGHYKKRHILVSMVFSMLNLAMVFWLLSLFMNNRGLFDAFFMQETSVYGSLLFFMLLYTPVEFVLSVLLQVLSRRHEFQADHFAVVTCPDGAALASALKKLSRSNLSNLTPHPFYVFLNYSHPPVLQRILRIEADAAAAHH